MISVPPRPLAARVSIAVVVGVLVALLLIGYGVLRIPATSLRSVAAAALVLVLYAVVGWTIIPRIATRNFAIIQVASWAGLLAGAIFTIEIVLEYIFLPADNTPFGLIEFGLVFLIYAGASAWLTYHRQRLRAGVLGAVGVALISSLIWCIAILTVFYLFYGTARQAQVFRAEGNLDDFQRSGMTDFNAFIMEDFLGASFFHLLLGPVLAMLLGGIGGVVGKGVRGLMRG